MAQLPLPTVARHQVGLPSSALCTAALKQAHLEMLLVNNGNIDNASEVLCRKLCTITACWFASLKLVMCLLPLTTSGCSKPHVPIWERQAPAATAEKKLVLNIPKVRQVLQRGPPFNMHQQPTKNTHWC
jgi:hypothetical protein